MPVKRRPWANLRDALQGRFGSMVNKVANMQSSQFADDSTSVVQYASDGATIKNLNYYEEYGDLME